MKNAVYFTLKSFFFFPRYLKFFLNCLVVQKNRLIKKIKLISTFYEVTTLEKNNCNASFARYLRQLIEYSIRNIFSWKTILKMWRIYSLIFFAKSQNWAYLGTNSLTFYTVCVYIFKGSCRPIAFSPYKVFLKTKRGKVV